LVPWRTLLDVTQTVPFAHAREIPQRRDLAEIAAAIALVTNGIARSVGLVNLADPLHSAGAGAAQASAAGVEFRLDRSSGNVAVVVGPCR
jgi:hypothetical protein